MTYMYEIRVAGHLDEHWSEWFDGLHMSRCQDGTTVFTGPVEDQSALHGLMAKVRSLGLQLLDVHRVSGGNPQGMNSPSWLPTR